MGQCKCSVPSVEEEVSAQEFRALDKNKNNMACRAEMADYVACHAAMWAMLSVNLNLSDSASQATATRVAMELASGLKGKNALNTEITPAQFHAFRCRYILDGKGAQEFFHRCVFASFDKNGDQSLDATELDAFLDTFYKSGSIFEGDARLPPKDELKQRILSNSVGYKNHASLTFEEIRDIIRGHAAGSSATQSPTPTVNPAAAPSTSTTEPSSRQLSQPLALSTSCKSSQAPVASESPEDTPEPDLAPPSIELTTSIPEQTPEVQPFGTLEAPQTATEAQPSGTLGEKLSKLPSAQDPKPRQRTMDRAKSRSRSPSGRAQRTKTRSSSPTERVTMRTTRSKSPSTNGRVVHKNRSKSPSARARRTSAARPSSSDELKAANDELISTSSHARKNRSISPTAAVARRHASSDNLKSSHHGPTRSPSARKERRPPRVSKSFDECRYTGHATTTQRQSSHVSKRQSSRSPTPPFIPPPPL